MKSPSGRLLLDVPTADDVDPLFDVVSDPRVWTHFPSLRPTEREEVATMVGRWINRWQRNGLDGWIVRLSDTKQVIGHVGCGVRSDAFWNLGYRFSADHHGHGYATEGSLVAIEQARRVRADLPVVAYLVEHNTASAVVAQKVGLTVQHRAPDAGNPDPSVMRVIYADRELSEIELAAALA